jgi:glycosyltransferase involved in cell wall biosynthesis
VNICFIGKNVLEPRFADNQLDAPLFREFAAHFDQVFLVYETDGLKPVESHDGNIHMYLVPRGRFGLRWPGFAFRAYAAARRIHGEHGIDIVSASDPFGGGLVSLLLKWRIKSRTVMQIQGQVLRLPKGKYTLLRRWLSRQVTVLVGRHSDAVRCVSNEIRDEAIHAGVSGAKLITVPNRCDTDLFDPDRWASERQPVREEYGIGPEEWVVSFVGRVEPAKGVDELLDALAEVKELRALLIGVVPEPGDVDSALETAGLTERVKLVGPVAHEQVPRYMGASDIFILPSKHEGAPRVVLEAMAMGLPVVASAVGGIPEVIDDGVNGVLLKESTGREIASVFRQLMSGSRESNEMGAVARRYVMEHRSFKPLLARLIGLHLEVAKRSTGVGG